MPKATCDGSSYTIHEAKATHKSGCTFLCFFAQFSIGKRSRLLSLLSQVEKGETPLKKTNRPPRSHLRVKNNHYYAVFQFIDEVTGKTKQKWFSLQLPATAGNKREAEDKLEELKISLHGIIDSPGYRITFTDYLLQWKEKKKSEVSEDRYQEIHKIVVGRLIPYFSPMKLALSEVKPKHIHALYQHLYTSGNKRTQEGLSISSIKDVKCCLNQLFRQAVIDGLLRFNPVESVKLPAKDNPRKPREVLDIESANQLLGSVQEDPLMYPILLLTLRYGLRRSEVLGLKWSAIDFGQDTLRIESVIVAAKNHERDKTKTETSRRSFPLLEDVREALLIRQKDQEKYLRMLGRSEKPIYIFTNPLGEYLKPAWLTRHFQQCLEDCNLPKMRFHDLRHSAACILYENGMRILDLQKWMRHGKLEMTADVYLHISKKREKELAEGLENMLSPDSPFEKQNTLENKIVIGTA